jgi:transposase
MHIDIVPNRKSAPAVLLRESWRDGGQVRKRTLANLSSLSMAQVEAIRAILRGEQLRPLAECLEVTASHGHGAVQAVTMAMKRLGFASLVATQPCRERDLVLAMVASRVVAPHTKLATTRWWQTTTLAEEFGVAAADEQDLYAAMDWLLERQGRIEKKLAARHLSADCLVLYDLSSSYFEGTHCPLAKRGYSRDGRKGTLQVNYGLLTDVRGCPVAVSVHEGNTADSKTLMPQVRQLRQDFGIGQVVMVGDRGMISSKSIDALQQTDGIGWITALKSASIRSLVEHGQVQLGLFDQRNLFEFAHPDYPGERLVACRNPELARLRAHTREDLLQATQKTLQKVCDSVAAGRLAGKDRIGVRVGKVVNQYKVAKHFTLDIGEDAFAFHRKPDSITAEAALDGIYIIRTSVSASRMDAADCVRHYKALANVERAFRSMKTIDLKVRPIHHRLADRVRAHIFLCMLAYYVEWHMRQAWRELMFADEDQAAKRTRDPVAPAKRSKAAAAKAQTHTLDDGTPAHSFSTLLAELSTIVRNTCRTPSAGPNAPIFQITTTANPKQRRALELLQQIEV